MTDDADFPPVVIDIRPPPTPIHFHATADDVMVVAGKRCALCDVERHERGRKAAA